MFVHRFSPSGRFHLALWAAANEGQMCLGAKARGTRLSPLFSQTYGFPWQGHLTRITPGLLIAVSLLSGAHKVGPAIRFVEFPECLSGH